MIDDAGEALGKVKPLMRIAGNVGGYIDDYDLIKNELEIFATAISPQLKLLNAPILISDYDAKTLLNNMMIKDV